MGVLGLWKALQDDKNFFDSVEELEGLLQRNWGTHMETSNQSDSHMSVDNDTHFIVDGMVVLLAVWHRDGFGSRTFLKTDDKLNQEVEQLAKSMASYIHFLPNNNHTTWVFDGPTAELPKSRNINRAKRRTKKLNQAVWLQFLSKKHGSRKLAASLLDRFCLPTRNLVLMTMRRLVDTYRLKVLMAPGEADFAISSLVTQNASYYKRSIVVSSDSDFTAFTTCEAVINPVKRYIH